MGESKEFHLPSDEHGGMESGTKVTLSKDHREFGEEVSAGTKLVVDAIVHFPTRYHLQDDSGKIWTVPVHSIDIASDQKEADSEPASEEK